MPPSTRNQFLTALACLVTAVVSPLAVAQRAAAPAKESTVTLSPFEVRSD
jgi:hypothetical protein